MTLGNYGVKLGITFKSSQVGLSYKGAMRFTRMFRLTTIPLHICTSNGGGFYFG